MDLSARAPTRICASRTRRIRPARAIRFVLKTALDRAAKTGPSVRMSPKAIRTSLGGLSQSIYVERVQDRPDYVKRDI